MEVKQWQAFVDRLLLAQGFDALRAPARVEFTFLNTVAGRKPNEGRTEKGSANTEAEKEQKPARRIPEQFRGFLVFDHFRCSPERH
jgi:hypothetical protein